MQTARGHRRTDLMDEAEYPAQLTMPGGNTVCLPYPAALIRLADEIDVAADRNPILLYDIDLLTDQTQIMFNSMILAVKKLALTESAITLYVDTPDAYILEQLRRMVRKMQTVLDYCRNTVHLRTPYVITQQSIKMVSIGAYAEG